MLGHLASLLPAFQQANEAGPRFENGTRSATLSSKRAQADGTGRQLEVLATVLAVVEERTDGTAVFHEPQPMGSRVEAGMSRLNG